MYYLMVLLLILFSLGIIFVVRYIAGWKTKLTTKHKDTLKEQLYNLEEEVSGLDLEIKDLAKKSAEITTLYELTKDLLKFQDKENAFGILRQRLGGYIRFLDLKFLREVSPEYRTSYQIFELKTKKAPLGFLAIKGLEPQDANLFFILANQFSLGLKRISLYQEIRELAITDSLTQISTRHYCLERFKEEFLRAKKNKTSLSFLMADIDHFKNFNDRYGHLVGDVVLQEVARIIKDNVRQIDLVGRFGGEEFCAIMPGTNKEGGRLAAERIRQAVAKSTISAYDEFLKVNISVGLANFPGDASLPDDLIDKADWALYRAKQNGRNRVCTYGMYR